MPSHFEELKRDIIFEWNAASNLDWKMIQMFFVEAYISSYEHCDSSEFDFEANLSKKEFIDKLKDHFTHLFLSEYEAIKTQNSNPQRIHYLVARFQDQPIAFFSCEQNPKSAKIYLRWVTVNPAFHQKGLGSAILAEVIKRFPQSNGLELYTRLANIHSRAFYKKCGFSSLSEIAFDEPDMKDNTKNFTPYMKSWLKNDKLNAPLDEKVDHIEKFIAFQKTHLMKV